MEAKTAISARSRQKRTSILMAAREVFLAQGYEGASVDLIAAKANVSKATLYAYFESKETLFREMQSDYLADQEAQITAIEQSNFDTVDGLHRIAEVVMAAWAQPGALQFSRMVMGEAARYPQLGRIFVETGVYRLQAVLERVFRGLTASGELDIPDPRLAAELFIGMTRSPLQMRSLHALGEPPTAAEMAEIGAAAARMIVAAFGKRA